MRQDKERTPEGLGRRSLLRRFGLGALVGMAGLAVEQKASAQTLPYSFWAHGNVAKAQFPDRLVRVEHRSTSAVFFAQPGTENWFHVTVGAPVFIRIARPTLFSANLVLRASGGVFLREVKLFDGETEKGATAGLSETGEVFQRIDIADPDYFSGLGISARIEFSNTSENPEVQIISAGVDVTVEQ